MGGNRGAIGGRWSVHARHADLLYLALLFPDFGQQALVLRPNLRVKVRALQLRFCASAHGRQLTAHLVAPLCRQRRGAWRGS